MKRRWRRAAGTILTYNAMFKYLFYLFIVLLIYDPIWTSYLYNVTDSYVLGTITLYYKYVVFSSGGFIAFIYILYRKTIPKSLFYGVGYLLSITIWTLYYFYGQYDRLLHTYIYYIPVMIYFFGVLLARYNLGNWVQVFLIIAFPSLIFGFIDYTLFNVEFWKNIVNIGKYINDIKHEGNTLLFELPGNYYFSPWVFKIRRFVGTLGDPLAFAYLFVFVVIIAYHEYFGKLKKTMLVTCVVALMLSLTRAVIISSIFVPIVYFIFRRFSFAIVLISGVFGLVIISMYYAMLTNYSMDPSFYGHIESLHALSALQWQDVILIPAVDNHELVFFESAVASIFYNYGSISLYLFLAFLYYIFKDALIHKNNAIVIGVLIVLFTLTVFSHSAISTLSSWIFWLYSGHYLGKRLWRSDFGSQPCAAGVENKCLPTVDT